MTNRYVTEAEKTGQRRRQAEYRKRLAKDGRSGRQIIATEAEDARLRQILMAWQGADASGLDAELHAAAVALKPTEDA